MRGAQALKTVEEMTEEIASYDTIAIRKAKQAVVRDLDLTLTKGLELGIGKKRYPKIQHYQRGSQ